MCPYCNSSEWRNSWGNGNAQCCHCDREFIVTLRDGESVGLPIPETIAVKQEDGKTLMMMKPEPILPIIHHIIRAEMGEILHIEANSYNEQDAWTEQMFVNNLRRRNCVGYSALWDNRVIGYIILEFHKYWLEIISLTVTKEYRLASVGQQLVAKVEWDFLRNNTRRGMIIGVDEHNITAQLFLKAYGFKCVHVYKSNSAKGDSYKFAYPVEGVKAEVVDYEQEPSDPV